MQKDSDQQVVWMPPSSSPGNPTPPMTSDGERTTSADRWALVALTISLTAVLSSCIPGFGCFAPLIAGIVALTQANKAANPERARTYGWVAVGIGGLFLLVMVVIIVLYGAALFGMFGQLQS